MTDDLISEYLPVISGHISNKYRWVDQRGNCMLSVDDLIQIASIALVKLAAKWDDILAERGEERAGNGGLFWRFLELEIKRDVHKYFQRTAHYEEPDPASFDTDDGLDIRTSLARHRDPSLTVADVADYYATLPLRDKILIALRYYDELPWQSVADILSAKFGNTAVLARIAVDRWRRYARNQFLEQPEPMSRQLKRSWEPPQSLHDYLRDRHRKDIHEYLGVVTIAFRTDPGYLFLILGKQQWFAPGAMDTGTLTPHHKHQIDVMLGAGMTMADAARRLNVPYTAVKWYVRRDRRAA